MPSWARSREDQEPTRWWYRGQWWVRDFTPAADEELEVDEQVMVVPSGNSAE